MSTIKEELAKRRAKKAEELEELNLTIETLNDALEI